jgi:hypothetical protein
MHQFVYEISIPIAGNNMSDFQIDLYPGDKLTVAFETNEFQRPEGRRGGNMAGEDRQPTGGMNGGGKSAMGRHGAMPRGDMTDRSEPVDLEVNITLVKAH